MNSWRCKTKNSAIAIGAHCLAAPLRLGILFLNLCDHCRAPKLPTGHGTGYYVESTPPLPVSMQNTIVRLVYPGRGHAANVLDHRHEYGGALKRAASGGRATHGLGLVALDSDGVLNISTITCQPASGRAGPPCPWESTMTSNENNAGSTGRGVVKRLACTNDRAHVSSPAACFRTV